MITIPLIGTTILSRKEDNDIAVKIALLLAQNEYLNSVVMGYQKTLDAATDIIAEISDQDECERGKQRVLAVLGEHFDFVGE